jgi:RNA-directed DNA polymerase
MEEAGLAMSLATPDNIRKFQTKLYEKAKGEPKFRFYQLYDKAYREDILLHAWKLARAHGGAPGVDGKTFSDIEAQGLDKWLETLREELHDKTYRPDPVRRVTIPKPGGGERPLGIPTIRDRVAQTAVKLVIEPIFEADFEDSAYGYRPGRSALDAVKQTHESMKDGYTDVVDADLSKYFDSIPHDKLMWCVRQRITDVHLLRLIEMWLKAPVEETDERGNKRLTGGKRSKTGTPQGGVVSPLLANIYMNRYLRLWRRKGKGEQFSARIVNYADDFVILSRGGAANALEWTRGVITQMGLTLNEKKTRLVNAREETFDFLGYTFGPQYYTRTGKRFLTAQPSKKSVQRLKERVRKKLAPGNQEPLPEVIKSLNRTLDGWRNYFSHGNTYLSYRAINNYVSDRMRFFVNRRCKKSTLDLNGLSRRVFVEMGVTCMMKDNAAPRP